MDFESKTLISAITATGNTIRGISYDPDNDAFGSLLIAGMAFKTYQRTGETLQTLSTIDNGISGFAYE